jgi:endonuclease YncB( thermonuclease family)
MYEYLATVLRVVDGDTMHFDCDLGIDVHIQLGCRVAHINAPEMSTAEGKAAKAWAAEWLAEYGPAFVVRTIKDHQEKYGRYLVEIANDAGEDFGSAMIAAGQAVAYEGGPR